LPSDPKALAQYRATIRQAWLGVAVLRKKFTGHETRLVARWFDQGIPAGIVVEAIKRTIERAKARSLPLYSIGIIQSDLMVVQRERASTQVGANSQRSSLGKPEAWRMKWTEELEEIAEGEPNPETAAMYRELLRQLPTLTREEARDRWNRIAYPAYQ
jgi:hypothetical protein